MAKLLANLEKYHRPESVSAAWELLLSEGSNTRLFAGGTSLAFTHPEIRSVIDLTGLPLNKVETESEWIKIGALTTIHELERHPAVIGFSDNAIVQACDRLASTPLRNMITVGGNIMAGYYWSDLPVIFQCLEAEALVYTGKTITVPLKKLSEYRGVGKGKNPGIVTHVLIPRNRNSARSAFFKFSRTQTDLSLVSVAASFFLTDGVMHDIRVVCGGLVPEPVRLTEAEKELEGRSPTTAIAETAGAHAAASIDPREDTRAGRAYRLDILKTLVQRAVMTACGGKS